MIKIDIQRCAGTIIEIEICDHAGYGDKGQDLVCAGVSSIAVGTMNALDQLCQDMCDLQMQEAYIHILVKQQSSTVQTVLTTMCIQLETMQESYSNFLTINDQEV